MDRDDVADPAPVPSLTEPRPVAEAADAPPVDLPPELDWVLAEDWLLPELDWVVPELTWLPALGWVLPELRRGALTVLGWVLRELGWVVPVLGWVLRVPCCAGCQPRLCTGAGLGAELGAGAVLG